MEDLKKIKKEAAGIEADLAAAERAKEEAEARLADIKEHMRSHNEADAQTAIAEAEKAIKELASRFAGKVSDVLAQVAEIERDWESMKTLQAEARMLVGERNRLVTELGFPEKRIAVKGLTIARDLGYACVGQTLEVNNFSKFLQGVTKYRVEIKKALKG